MLRLLLVNYVAKLGLLIDNYSELDSVLLTISQKSRGKTVYVTGSHEQGNPIAHCLGTLLAKEKEITLISGQSSGIGSDVVSAFTEQCIKDKHDINNRLQMFPNPYAANPNFSNDRGLLPDLKKKSRAKLMNSTQVVLAFNGKMGTEAELEVAKDRNCKIIPVVLHANDLQNEMFRKLLDDPLIIENLKEIDQPDIITDLSTRKICTTDTYGTNYLARWRDINKRFNRKGV